MAVTLSSQTLKRSDYTRIHKQVANARTLPQQQVVLAEMQKMHASFSRKEEREDQIASLGGIGFYWLWTKEYAELNKQMGYYAEAEQAYNDFIAYVGDDTSKSVKTARQNLLYIWNRQGKYTEVIHMVNSGLLSDNEDDRLQAQFVLAEAHYNRNLHLEPGKDDCNIACEILEKIIIEHQAAKDADYIKAICNLSLMYLGFDEEYSLSAYRLVKQGLDYFRSKGIDALSEKDNKDYYTILSNAAYIEGKIGKFEDALAHINQAIDWQAKNYSGWDSHYASSLWKKAMILYEQAQSQGDSVTKDAVQAFKDYFGVQKEYILHHFAFMTEHERQSFWAAQYEPLSSCYLVGDKDPEFAYEVALFMKNVQVQTNLDIRAIGQQTKNRRLIELANQYDTCRNDSRRQADIEKKMIEILGANTIYQKFVASMKMKPDEVSKKLGKNGVAIEWIETVVDRDSMYVALVMDAKGNVEFKPAISKNTLLNRNVSGENLRNATVSKDADLKNDIYNDSILGKQLWDIVMTCIPEHSNIYFAPSGVLHLLAIEYLQFDKKDCCFYRLSSTGELCRKHTSQWNDIKTLIVGGIDYNKYDKTEQEIPNPDRTGYNTLSRKYMFGKDMVFDRLDGADREVDSIMAILGDSMKNLIAKDVYATERFLKDYMPKYDIVHLSTHGYSLDYGNGRLLQRDSLMQDQLMARSGLACSGANVVALKNLHLEDGILTAKEVSELDLNNVKLVSLSACQTAIGKITDEEVSSISRGFKKAGAGAMIVSLWSTDDDASQVFFTRFFEFLEEDENHSIRKAFDDAREYMKNAGEVLILYTVKTLNPKTLSGGTARTLSRTVNLSQPKYYDSYILIDAIQ